MRTLFAELAVAVSDVSCWESDLTLAKTYLPNSASRATKRRGKVPIAPNVGFIMSATQQQIKR